MSQLLQLPTETLWRILILTDSPKVVLTELPRLCRSFRSVIQARAISVLANVDLICEDEEEGTTLIQPPERAKLCRGFRPVRVARGRSISKDPGDHCGNDNDVVAWCAAERSIRIHMSAITVSSSPTRSSCSLTSEQPSVEPLAEYLRALLSLGLGGCSKRAVRVHFGTVQIRGRRGTTCATICGNFLKALRPVNVTLWWWDSDLIAALPESTSSLRVPNMRGDGHIQQRDLALLPAGIKRLELFRPMPRQPWGLEAASFSSLASLNTLKELVVRSGRLVGSHEALSNGIMALRHLKVLELPWNLDSRVGARLLHGLPQLERLQFVLVQSPDFFQGLPSYYANVYHSQNSPLGSPVAHDALRSLRALGLTFMEPDAGDITAMVEALVRVVPKGLRELFVRVNSQNGSTYDFFAIPKEFTERALRRLESRTCIRTVAIEMGLRQHGSRRNYADELTSTFKRGMSVKIYNSTIILARIE